MKAKNEIMKANEIAFITLLENQNKKLTLDQKLQDTRDRKLLIVENVRTKQM